MGNSAKVKIVVETTTTFKLSALRADVSEHVEENYHTVVDGFPLCLLT